MFRDGLANNGIQHQRLFRMLCSVHHRCCAMANQRSMVSRMILLVCRGHGYHPILLIYDKNKLKQLITFKLKVWNWNGPVNYLWAIWRMIARIWLFCSAFHYDRSFPNVVWTCLFSWFSFAKRKEWKENTILKLFVD